MSVKSEFGERNKGRNRRKVRNDRSPLGRLESVLPLYETVRRILEIDTGERSTRVDVERGRLGYEVSMARSK